MEDKNFRKRGAIWCAFAPFFVAATLFVLLELSALSGISGLGSNTYVLFAMSAIFSGVILGVTSLLIAHSLALWARFTIGLLYFPAVIFSLLVSGM